MSAWSLILFAAILIGLGIGGLFYTDQVSSFVDKITGKETYAAKHPVETKFTMKLSGAFAILMGLIILWVALAK